MNFTPWFWNKRKVQKYNIMQNCLKIRDFTELMKAIKESGIYFVCLTLNSPNSNPAEQAW